MKAWARDRSNEKHGRRVAGINAVKCGDEMFGLDAVVRTITQFVSVVCMIMHVLERFIYLGM